MKVVGGEHVTDRQLALVSGMEEELVFLDDNGVQLDDFHILKDPLFGQTVAGPSRVDEKETKHYMIEGVDPDADEPAGADEEW